MLDWLRANKMFCIFNPLQKSCFKANSEEMNMSDFTFNKEEYLKRISFPNKEVAVDFETLKAIHRAQHTAVPFENFDILLGREIRLEPKSLFQKLVGQKRGGYCFELNGLLLMALKEFGFEARPLLGRVHLSGEPSGRSHQTTLVTIGDEKWLVDVGFGAESPLIPIPIVHDQPVSFEDQSYRIINDAQFGYMLQSKQGADWKNLHSFDLNPVLEIDIKFGNHFTSTSPESFFANARIAALPVENGRLTLYNDRIKKVLNGKEEVIMLKDDASYLAALEKEYGITIDAEYNALKPLPAKTS